MVTTMRETLADRPNAVTWEVSRACDLVCLHCRAVTQSKRSALELSTCEGYDLIEQVAELMPSRFIFTGGDPLKRDDLFELVDVANRRRLDTTLSTSATPLLSHVAIERMRDAGLGRLSLALDGPSREVHEAVRGVSGSFCATLDAIDHAISIGLPVEVSSVLSRFNLSQVGEMMSLLSDLGIEAWNLSFYVPSGAGRVDDMINAQDAEEVFATLYAGAGRLPFEINATEAMHYRRYVLQRAIRENPTLARRAFECGLDYGVLLSWMQSNETDSDCPKPLAGVNDQRESLFVSHIGEVYPGGFLPLSGGNIRFRQLAQIYRTSPLFTTLRDRAELSGKCGVCEFNEVCGGSRARAYAVACDPLAAEPLCAYQPVMMRGDASVRSAAC